MTVKPELPPPAPWKDRSKSFDPLPGGYDGYLDSLERIGKTVAASHPNPAQLAELMEKEFEEIQSVFAARVRVNFLIRAGLIHISDGKCYITEHMQKWMDTDDVAALVGIIHSRVRFVGEMLQELKEPLHTEALLSIANYRYGMGWITRTQIGMRRGWLQSAKLIEVVDEQRLITTEAGRKLVSRLVLHIPKDKDPLAPSNDETETGEEHKVTAAEHLASHIVEASTDSKNPTRFEKVVRDAFDFLGFDALWLGGKGNPDVLLDAPLGRDESYRVTVEAKTVGAGALGEGQVGWTNLEDHRLKHGGHYSLLVGPEPKDGRLIERAQEKGVAVISAKELAFLCQQHEQVPLGLATYRILFAQRKEDKWVRHGGRIDTTYLDEAADEAARLQYLTSAVLRVLSERCGRVGPLTARESWVILEPDDVAEGSSADEIQHLMDMLAHPLVRAVDGDAQGGYVLSSNPAVTRLRLELLARSIAPGSNPI